MPFLMVNLPLLWAAGLLLSVVLDASLLVSVPTFVSLATWCDHPVPAWSSAAFGYFCITVLANRRRSPFEPGKIEPDSLGVTAGRSLRLPLALLAFAGYTLHLLLLRWPWLTGKATIDSRLTLWSAALSNTWHGLPILAFGELLGLAAMFTQAHLALSSHLAERLTTHFGTGARRLCLASTFVAYGLASAVVILLATGRR